MGQRCCEIGGDRVEGMSVADAALIPCDAPDNRNAVGCESCGRVLEQPGRYRDAE